MNSGTRTSQPSQTIELNQTGSAVILFYRTVWPSDLGKGFFDNLPWQEKLRPKRRQLHIIQ